MSMISEVLKTVESRKSYKNYTFSDIIDILSGKIDGFEVPTDIIERLNKELGISPALYNTLMSISDKVLLNSLLQILLSPRDISNITLLVSEDKATGYVMNTTRNPLLNIEFLKRVSSLVDANDSVEISEYYYLGDDTKSQVILSAKNPVIIEEKYENADSKIYEYNVGILLVNDELGAVTSRLVCYISGQPLYFPASYYNATSSRYTRSTSNSAEALEVLLLKVIEDLRDGNLYNKIYDFHHRYRVTKNIVASYEEYNTLLRVVSKIPSVIEDNSYLESLKLRYDDFEKRYSHLPEKKSSYIWRCTALSDIPIGVLISLTSNILCDLNAPSIEYNEVRDLLGSYMCTNRMVEEIAKEDTY